MITNSDDNSSTNLDNIISDLNRISLSDNIMAPPEINFQLMKLHVDTVPTYDGDQTTLEIFISSCDHLFTTFSSSDPLINSYLVRVVIGKLVGRAQILVATRAELNTWPLIKSALRSCFGDQRNLDCLEQDLILLRPQRNESPLDFGRRIQVTRSKLSTKINSLSALEMPETTKAVYLKQYDSLALKTFIRGLTGSLRSIIRLQNPRSLEIAMNLVIEEQNFHYTQNLTYHNNRSPQPQMNNKKPQSPFNNTPQYPQKNFFHHQTYQKPNFYEPTHQIQNKQYQTPNFHQPHNNTNFNSTNKTQNFPSQPINVNPRPVQSKYLTNSQVFGTPKNVFKPTGQLPKDKPEPMSTTSRNPTIRSHFNNNQTRNFHSEELYHVENNFYHNSDLSEPSTSSINNDYYPQDSDTDNDLTQSLTNDDQNFPLNADSYQKT